MPTRKTPASRARPLPAVQAFTDGGCSPNPGDGGWGVVLIDAKGRRKELWGGQRDTTNNRMEITAALMALRALKKPCAVTLTSDSQYVVKAFTDGWLDGWQRKGWRTASKEPVKNRDLWEEMLTLTATHQVTWVWTRGHAGHPENERCDELCAMGRASLRGATGPTWFEQAVT